MSFSDIRSCADFLHAGSHLQKTMLASLAEEVFNLK